MDKEAVRQILSQLKTLDDRERALLALDDPWFLLTGYPLGKEWTPGPSKGMVFTLDEHDADVPIKRFPNKKYLWRATRDWMDNNKVVVAKSRQIMISWLMIALHLWLILSRKGRLVFFQNKKEEDAKEMLRRAKFIYHQLPVSLKSMRPIRTPESKIELEINGWHSRIKAVPQGADILRQHTASAIFSDESAFQDQAEDAYTAAKPTIDGGGRFTTVSTANGKNFFYNLWADAGATETVPGETPIKGYQIRKNRNGFAALRVHYSADPDKDPDTEAGRKWLEETKTTDITPERWDREMEINFSLGGGHRIYKGFNRNLHCRNLVFNPERPLYRIWDFGYVHPAVLWIQLNDKDQVCVLREKQGTDVSIYEFAPEIIKLTTELYPKAVLRNFSDPAGLQHSDKGDKTTLDILRKDFHVVCRHQRMSVLTGLEWIRKLLMPRTDKEPGLLIDEDHCPILIEGFEGGYVSKVSDPDTPEDDGYFEHVHDDLRYFVNNMYRKLGLSLDLTKTVENRMTQGRIVNNAFKRRNKFTGY